MGQNPKDKFLEGLKRDEELLQSFADHIPEANKKVEPESGDLYINTAGIRRMAQSVKDGQGTRVGSMAKMLIDCCDEIDRLTTNNKDLTKQLMEHGEALKVLLMLRQLYNISPDTREPKVESAAKMLMKTSEEGLRLAQQRTQEEYIKQLEIENEKMETALRRIDTWSKAYPVAIFPKPDLKRAAEVLKAAGITLDDISADSMRHVLDGIKDIIEQALKESEL